MTTKGAVGSIAPVSASIAKHTMTISFIAVATVPRSGFPEAVLRSNSGAHPRLSCRTWYTLPSGPGPGAQCRLASSPRRQSRCDGSRARPSSRSATAAHHASGYDRASPAGLGAAAVVVWPVDRRGDRARACGQYSGKSRNRWVVDFDQTRFLISLQSRLDGDTRNYDVYVCRVPSGCRTETSGS